MNVTAVFSALALILASGMGCAQVRTTYVDFGSSIQQTASPDAAGHYWNNVTDTQWTAGIGNLVSDNGTATSVSLSMAGVIGANPFGTTVPDATALGGLAVASATSDWFYIAPGGVFTVTLGNMPLDGNYRISLFGSRDAADVRVTRYDVVGLASSSQLLTCSGPGIGIAPQPNANRSGLAVFSNVTPAADGTIVISVRCQSGSFGYLSAMRLEQMNVVNSPPAASGVAIAGAPRVGSSLVGRYTYADPESDPESGTQFVWESADSAAGAGRLQIVAPSTSAKTWAPTAAEQGRYVRIGVLPKASRGGIAGTMVYSSWLGPVAPRTALTTFHVGSSFTRWANIPQELTDLAAASGQVVLTGNQLADGHNLQYHWDAGLGGGWFINTGTPCRYEIPTGTWDVFVLQPYNSEWTDPSIDAHAKLFYDMADAAGSQMYLYDYWPWHSQPLSTQTDINNTFERVRASVSAGGHKACLIIPAGEAVRAVINEAGTGVLAGLTRDSFYQDDLHLNDLGFYISALAHYATIMKKSPVGLPASAYSSDYQTDTPVTFPPAVAKRVQQIVWDVVRTYPNSGVDVPGPPSVPDEIPPSVSDVAIAGAPRVGSSLVGRYTYADLASDPESGTQFVWESASSPTGVGKQQIVAPSTSAKTWAPTDAEQGRYVRIGVLPKASNGTIIGSLVYSNWLGPVAPRTALTTFHVGSSFTRWANIPQELTDLAAASGQVVLTGNQLADGHNLQYHWDAGLGGGWFINTGTPCRYEIPTGTWDVFVLQPYNSEWTDPSIDAHAKLFYDMADAAGSQMYLYDYWPWHSQPLSTQTDINNTFERVRASVSAGGHKACLIIPAGEAVRAVINEAATGVGPLAGLTRDSLYQDDLHLNDLGFYISALAHYATIMKKSPVGLPARAYSSDYQTDTPVTFSPAVAKRVQQIVWDVVRTYPNSGVDVPGPPSVPDVIPPPVITPVPPDTVTTTDPNASVAPTSLTTAFGPAVNGKIPLSHLPHLAAPSAAGKMAIEYTVDPAQVAGGTTYTVEWSSDLIHWTAIPPTGLVTTQVNQTVHVECPASQGTHFVRVHVVSGS